MTEARSIDLPRPFGWMRFRDGAWREIVGPVDSREILRTPARLRELQCPLSGLRQRDQGLAGDTQDHGAAPVARIEAKQGRAVGIEWLKMDVFDNPKPRIECERIGPGIGEHGADLEGGGGCEYHLTAPTIDREFEHDASVVTTTDLRLVNIDYRHAISSVAGVSNPTVADAGGEGNAPGKGIGGGSDGGVPAEAGVDGVSVTFHAKGYSA